MDPQKEKKLKKVLPAGFADSIESASTESLKSTVSQVALQINEVETARDSNEEIQKLREQLELIRGPFSDTLKVLKAKIKYIALVLEERGAR